MEANVEDLGLTDYGGRCRQDVVGSDQHNALLISSQVLEFLMINLSIEPSIL